jgi:hypothetical protein
MAAFLELPEWLLAIVVIGGLTAVGVMLVLALRPFVSRRLGDEHNAVFGGGFGAVATMYAIIAGLLVFGVFTTFDSAEHASSDEAATLVTMYRNSQVFPQPYRAQSQIAIKSYTTSVIDDDWPAMAHGQGSNETSKALDRLFTVIGAMEPAPAWSDQYSAVYGHLNDVVKLRDERINLGQSTLSGIYWFLLFAGGFLIILNLSFIYMESRTMHAIAVGLTSAMLGVVLFLLVALNHPFQGDVAISPDSFQNALTSMEVS